MSVHTGVCVYTDVRACMRACVRACMRATTADGITNQAVLSLNMKFSLYLIVIICV